MAQTVFERFAAAKLDFYTIAKFKNEVILPFKQELERVSNDTWKVYNVQKSNRKTISGLESYFEAKLWNSSQATKGEVSVAMLSHNG